MNLYTERVKPEILCRIGRVAATLQRQRLMQFLLCVFMDVTTRVILQHCVVESLHNDRDCRMSRMSNIEPMTFLFHVGFSRNFSTLSGQTHMCIQVRLGGHRPSEDALRWLLPHPQRSATDYSSGAIGQCGQKMKLSICASSRRTHSWPRRSVEMSGQLQLPRNVGIR